MIDRALFALPGIKKVLCSLIGFAALRAFITIGQALALTRTLVNLWSGESSIDQLYFIAIFLVCFIAKQGVANVQDAFLDRYAYEQADRLRHRLLEKMFITRRLTRESGTGNITTTVLEGIDQVETYFRLILPKITGILIIPVILLITIFVLDWVSGLIFLIAFPAIIMYMVIIGHTAKDKAAKQHKTYQILSNHFIDSLRGLDTLKFFGISKSHGKNIYEISERFRVATLKTLQVATLSGAALDLFSTLSLAAASILLGIRLVDGSLALFPALAVITFAPEYFRPIRDFAADYHASLDGKNALSSIMKILDEPDETVDEVAVPPWTETTDMKVSDLSFSYPDYTAISQVSFEVRGYKKIGIVGMSGAGKSTLIDVLGGFCSPEKGHIEIGGSYLASFKQGDWQNQINYIPQDPYIFHATLKDNIAFYHPQATESELNSAIEVVGLQQLISELPYGLDTVIGEGARALSGGQAQRIALARIFLDKSRKILLFDEPTAHLDIETEMELKERMLPLMEDRLVIFATHRLHWMHDMDTIFVLDEGRIVEQGTLQELKENNGSFTKLVSRMSGGIL